MPERMRKMIAGVVTLAGLLIIKAVDRDVKNNVNKERKA